MLSNGNVYTFEEKRSKLSVILANLKFEEKISLTPITIMYTDTIDSHIYSDVDFA